MASAGPTPPPIRAPPRAYGPLTRDAVLNWQQREHIEADVVGPQTRVSLGLPASVPVSA
jgi:hypothetical protein